MAPPRVLRSQARRAYKSSELGGRVRLAFTDCLGPCSESNVVFVYLHGQPLWFRRVNSPDAFTAVLDYARAALTDPACPLPDGLRALSFSWMGGGAGPAPPVQDVASPTLVEAEA